MATKLLKVSSPHIKLPLNYLYNKTVSKGIYPDRLKSG